MSKNDEILDTKFNVQNTTDWYEIRQACDAVPGGTPSAANCSLGLTASYYSGGGFFSSVTISCSTSESLFSFNNANLA